MEKLFNNKYRIPSARLQNWNYANEAMYFVTICTKNRENYFGEIVYNTVETQCIASLPQQQILQPTEIGKIAHFEWYKSIELRPDMNLELGEFVVMPNHFHGIIIINENQFNAQRGGATDADIRDRDDDRDRRDAMHRVSTHPTPHTPATHSPATTTNKPVNQFAPQSKNLASIVRGYKSAVTTHARKNDIAFGWQPRYHDHIIRSMDEYHRISNYIINNPAQWQNDKFFLLRLPTYTFSIRSCYWFEYIQLFYDLF